MHDTRYPYAPARFTSGEIASEAWRIARAEAAERIFWINQHRATLDRATERPTYLAYVRDRLVEHTRAYLDHVRTASEAEVAMTAAGHQFNGEARL